MYRRRMSATPGTREPSRRPRISREFLEQHRRLRFVDATAEILHEFGRRGATTTNVVRLAGGARNSFYEVFSSVEDCISYGIGLAEAELFAGLEAESGGDWLGDVRRAIDSFYQAVAARPLRAELYLVHAAASRTDIGRAAFRDGGARFAPLLARGGGEAEALGRRPPPEVVGEALSRAIVCLPSRRVGGQEVATLTGESRAMAALVGAYYLGPETTKEMLDRPRTIVG
jgi:AcrR family transcriptional regulator